MSNDLCTCHCYLYRELYIELLAIGILAICMRRSSLHTKAIGPPTSPVLHVYGHSQASKSAFPTPNLCSPGRKSGNTLEFYSDLGLVSFARQLDGPLMRMESIRCGTQVPALRDYTSLPRVTMLYYSPRIFTCRKYLADYIESMYAYLFK